MSSELSRDLSLDAVAVRSTADVRQLIPDAERDLGGLNWAPLGGIPNNVHTVEVASDPALALVERPINGVDALLDLRARELGATADSPHAGARAWWDVPTGGIGRMSAKDRQRLADQLRMTMLESGVAKRPTIEIRDGGSGQHPDEWSGTLLSLLASNKKEKRHQMGVYNAGGAASYRFSTYATVISRLAPSLLEGRTDEIGWTVVRYNPLDPERYKTGRYEYLTDRAGDIVRLILPRGELPESDRLEHLPHGTIIRLVEYDLARYARGAHEPKQSLWHLLDAALPDPALPVRMIETRNERFSGVRGEERRVAAGLLYSLARDGIADYNDERHLDLGPDIGSITVRYFVVNEGVDADRYTTADQALTITLNGQRQAVRDRQWLKRKTELQFLFNRLVVFIDATGLTNQAKRSVFSSTRESGVDSDITDLLLARTLDELKDDDGLVSLDEAARQRVVDKATATTSEKVKKQMADAIGKFLKGPELGAKGGRRRKSRRKRRGGDSPPPPDDSLMLEVPDLLRVVEPVEVVAGASASVKLDINAKNDFLPLHGHGLSVVITGELAQHVRLRSKGKLLGGRARLTLTSDIEAPATTSELKVALVVPELGVMLTDTSTCTVLPPSRDDDEPDDQGGDLDIKVEWVGRDAWERLEWDASDVGTCLIRRDTEDTTTIIAVEWILNEAFQPFEAVAEDRRTQSEAAFKHFRENYEFPVLFGLFRQQLAADEQADAEEHDGQGDLSRTYLKGERFRLAQAVLMAMDPTLTAVAAASV